MKAPLIHIIDGESVSAAVHKAFKTIKEHGVKKSSRNGTATFINDAEFIVNDPTQRHLCLKGRTSNIFQLIAETLWVVSGKDELYPYLNFFLPRAPQYSDDGFTWRGAYGKRIYNHDQLQGVVDTFCKDGENTRRAYVSIHDASIDAPQCVDKAFPDGTRDTPCNLGMLFYTGTDDCFHARTIQRSGDVIFGAGSINLFEFTFIQEMMRFFINRASGYDIPMGSYRHSTVNLHVYESTEKQVDAVLSDPDNDAMLNHVGGFERRGYPLIFPESIAQTRLMCSDFIDKICVPLIAGQHNNMSRVIQEINVLFDNYETTKPRNLLYVYMKLVAAYIVSTRKINPLTDVEMIMIDEMSPITNLDLYWAVKSSSFRKFKIDEVRCEIDYNVKIRDANTLSKDVGNKK